MTAALIPIADDLWVAPRPFRFLGVFPIGTRMTVVRLASGELWLGSPVAIDDDLAAALAALGPVAHLVGPNRFHHLYLGPALARYPDAALHLAPGLAEKRPDLPPGQVLLNEPPPVWADDLDQQILEGVPTFNEVAFLHRSSRTLILTDHLFHLGDHLSPGARLLGTLLGVRRRPGLPLDARLGFIRDRRALRRGIDHVLQWEFDRIVLTHGSIVEKNGQDVLRRAYRFLS